jgi:O-antigen chain-terminating methyltransferase
MDDNTIEIRDNEINVEEIMAKIRENIRRRKAAGEMPPDPDSIIGSISKKCSGDESDNSIKRDLSYINAYWDVQNYDYLISSHQPLIGKFLIKGRQIINGEVHRYIDFIISRQTEFNACLVRIITHALQRYAELNERQQELIQHQQELIQRQQELETAFSSFKSEVKKNIDHRVNELFNQVELDIRGRAWLAHMLEDRIQTKLTEKTTPPSAPVLKENANYFLFEERFRGSREEIRQRQLAFLPCFEKCSRVLDIGCGRGEFLEILRDHNIGGIGVDSDPDMVAFCRSRQLEVENSDAISYLETLKDKSLDGIFIDQVVEHLEPRYLIRLLALCHQKMKFGYTIVVETVNPLSFVSIVNFYVDMTHKRPVHPETLQYLLSATGFRECEKKFFSPVSEESRLNKITDIPHADDPSLKNIESYNHNIDVLNFVLFGAQDYAVIGKK